MAEDAKKLLEVADWKAIPTDRQWNAFCQNLRTIAVRLEAAQAPDAWLAERIRAIVEKWKFVDGYNATAAIKDVWRELAAAPPPAASGPTIRETFLHGWLCSNKLPVSGRDKAFADFLASHGQTPAHGPSARITPAQLTDAVKK